MERRGDKSLKCSRNEDIKTLLFAADKLEWRIEKMHQNILYIYWRQLPSNMDLKF